MCRSDRMSIWAYEQAVLSKCSFQHGAIISKGGKIIIKGRNTNRTKYLNTMGICLHAEIDVAMKLINCYIKKQSKGKKIKGQKQIKYNLKKYIIWVVRASKNKNKSEAFNYRYSAPCAECIKTLIELGFKKIGFSDENGNITVKNIDNIKNTHISYAQQTFLNRHIHY